MNKKKYPIPATIVIRLNADETTATIMGDEFRTRITRSLAKRNPKDEYDAYIGARVALDRLFDKEFFGENLVEAAPEKADATEKTEATEEETEFQVGDIVRVTNSTFSFGFYKNGDVAVVTEVVPPLASWVRTAYHIKVRSKERKGSEGVAFAEELTLLHRPAKEGETGGPVLRREPSLRLPSTERTPLSQKPQAQK